MSEQEAIDKSAEPCTRTGLAAGLRVVGVQMGTSLIVHSSLRSLGWVSGGAQTVIEALQDALGPHGTLAMPTQSGAISDPALWRNPPVPESWWDTIRETMPAFDPARTPTRAMGAIPELFRTWPGVRRSAHPANSFAALGPNAELITQHQALDDPFGESSPLARLYDCDASILLIGTDYDSCTALHLAERRAYPDAPTQRAGAPLIVQGERRWINYTTPCVHTERFPELGEWLEGQGAVTTGTIGLAQCRFMSLQRTVDLGTQWLRDASLAR